MFIAIEGVWIVLIIVIDAGIIDVQSMTRNEITIVIYAFTDIP